SHHRAGRICRCRPSHRRRSSPGSMPSWPVYCPTTPHKAARQPDAVGCFQGLHMDTKLLDILACPLCKGPFKACEDKSEKMCKGPLKVADDKSELICKVDALAFPVRDGIPVMLEGEARTLDVDERLDK